MTPSRLSMVLWTLMAMFVGRVLGQVLVEFGGAPFLPPSPEWFSGRIPYPVLLVLQLCVIAVLSWICLSIQRRSGWVFTPWRPLGRLLLTFGSVYALVMVTRYAVRMSLYPGERWFGGCIPIVFHLVLATFVLVWGWHHWRHDQTAPQAVTFRRRLLRWSGTVVGLLAIAVGYAAWLTYLLLPTWLAHELGLRRAEYAVRAEPTAWVIAEDGCRLATWVYRPYRSPAQTATILVRIPLPQGWSYRLSTDVIGRMWAERGYTAVIQPVRGRAPSEGVYVPFLHERSDGKATLAWIADQPWSNGKIGMWGGSYFAYTQWVLAAQSEPGLSAGIVMESSTRFREMFHPGGAFALESALTWALTSHGDDEVFPTSDVIDRGVNGWPLIEADDRASLDIPFFNRWTEGTDRDDYWQQVDGSDRTRALRYPVLLMAGWYDPFLESQLRDYREIRGHADPRVAQESRLVIGPWGHAWTVMDPHGPLDRHFRLASLADTIPWFDRHLNSRKDVPVMPPVRLFVMGINTWRDEQEWPLARAQETDYFLRPTRAAGETRRAQAGELATSLDGESRPLRYTYDPQSPVQTRGGAMLGIRAGLADQLPIESRDDVLVFTGGVLADDLEVTGPVQVTLFVTSDAPGTDFVARLCDVHPDGHSWNVTEGITRVKLIDSNAPQEVSISLAATSMVFRKGHRLRVHVTSSSYPQWDRHPNTAEADPRETQPRVARNTVYFGGATPSRITLPVIPH